MGKRWHDHHYDDQGIVVYAGGWTRFPTWRLLALVGIALLPAAILMAALWFWYTSVFFSSWPWVAVGVSGAIVYQYIRAIVGWAQVRRAVSQSVSAQEMAVRLGMTESEFGEFARKYELPVWFRLNNDDRYSPEQIGELSKLLRPAEGPVELLRAAQSVEHPDEVLVRPSESSD